MKNSPDILIFEYGKKQLLLTVVTLIDFDLTLIIIKLV